MKPYDLAISHGEVADPAPFIIKWSFVVPATSNDEISTPYSKVFPEWAVSKKVSQNCDCPISEWTPVGTPTIYDEIYFIKTDRNGNILNFIILELV